jgi:hypothetical protein
MSYTAHKICVLWNVLGINCIVIVNIIISGCLLLVCLYIIKQVS